MTKDISIPINYQQLPNDGNGYLNNNGAGILTWNELDNVKGLSKEYTQSGHGLSVLDAVRLDNGDWIKAQANLADNLATGIVTAVNGNDITVSISGFYNINSHGLTDDEYYMLSDSTAGGS